MHTEQIQTKTDAEWLHEIGSHIAAGHALDETFAAAVNFASALVNCDLCFISIREGAELVPWAGSQPEHEVVGHIRLSPGQDCVAFLAKHRVPIAISLNIARDNGKYPRFRLFKQWSADPGETFVSVPLLAREKLMGVINLQHRQPRQYSLREVKLFSSVGFLLGTEIGISRLESQNSDLLLQLETRKLLERGKGILQRDLGLTEEQAYLTLQRQSRQSRKSIKEIAQAVILGDEVKRNLLTDTAVI